MKPVLLLFSLTCSVSGIAQDFTFPDSAAIVNNKIKVARIYFNSPDGKKYQQKELHYDQAGRIIKEANDGHSFYYLYTYDEKGRRISSTQRSVTGEFIQKFAEEYDDKTGNRTTRLYTSYDTLNPSHIYVFDSKNRKIKEEQYNKTNLQFVYKMTYDEKGDVVASYDSSSSSRTASWREHTKLVRQRTYDVHGSFLHEYRYTYDYFGRVWKMTDSTGTSKTITYENVYPKDGGPCEGIKRNGKFMPDSESKNFRKEHPEFRSYDGFELENQYGLPVPEMVNTHEITRDKKGNITRDVLTQTQGSFSQAYVYEYEYEFY